MGLTKDALKLLLPDHPARALSQQRDKIGVMQKERRRIADISRIQDCGAKSCKEED